MPRINSPVGLAAAGRDMLPSRSDINGVVGNGSIVNYAKLSPVNDPNRPGPLAGLTPAGKSTRTKVPK